MLLTGSIIAVFEAQAQSTLYQAVQDSVLEVNEYGEAEIWEPSSGCGGGSSIPMATMDFLCHYVDENADEVDEKLVGDYRVIRKRASIPKDGSGFLILSAVDSIPLKDYSMPHTTRLEVQFEGAAAIEEVRTCPVNQKVIVAYTSQSGASVDDLSVVPIPIDEAVWYESNMETVFEMNEPFFVKNDIQWRCYFSLVRFESLLSSAGLVLNHYSGGGYHYVWID